jgi:hypothetical protein
MSMQILSTRPHTVSIGARFYSMMFHLTISIQLHPEIRKPLTVQTSLRHANVRFHMLNRTDHTHFYLA